MKADWNRLVLHTCVEESVRRVSDLNDSLTRSWGWIGDKSRIASHSRVYEGHALKLSDAV